MIFYRLVRFLLFLLPAETAHYFTMWLLELPFATYIFSGNVDHEEELGFTIAGIHFRNPIGLAAGFDKNAKWIPILSKLGFGHIEIGTVTPKAQPGNPKPRLFRLKKDKALINRMGFNNDGADIIAKRLSKIDRSIINVVIGGNIGKNKITPNENAVEDYLYSFEKLYEYVDYFAVNVSSPNTPGLRVLQEKKSLTNILSALQDLNQHKNIAKPIFLKIAPDLNIDQLNEIIEVVIETGLSGIIATNTTVSRDNLISDKSIVDHAGAGGLSGAPLQNISDSVLSYLHANCPDSIILISSGGIMDPDIAIKRLNDGASLVQIYTGFIYEGPGLVKRIKKQMLQPKH